MARELRSLCFVVLLLLCLSIVLSQSEARYLKVASSFKKMEDSFTKLAPRGIKQSGPSPGGPGHRSGNAQLLGPIKQSASEKTKQAGAGMQVADGGHAPWMIQ
ncbi:hypothetical protein Peur_073709 [Populus x canadensis]